MRPLLMVAALALFQMTGRAQVRPITPKLAPAPVGPYTPGLATEDYLYVSGQGARRADGSMPSAFEDHVRQTMENVKSIVEGDGLTMQHVVYMHVYLTDMGKFAEMNRIYAAYFPQAPPARATVGAARLPAGNVVEITAVALRNLAHKKVIKLAGQDPGEPVSAGILTHDRLFVSGMRGRDLKTGKVPDDPGAQVDLALDGMKAVCEAAGISLAHMVFVNPYLTNRIPLTVMNTLYAKRFEFGNTPARATIQVSTLPENSDIEFTGVAVRDLSRRRAVRPKNMAPSPTASPCVFAGDTLYCSAKSGFIPGLNGGIFATTVEHQVRQTMRNLLDNLEEAEMEFSQVVATNVYLDDIADFGAMNKVYAKYFDKGAPPTRTTIQQVEAADRKPDEEGRFPTLEQVSLIAIRPARR